MSIEEIIVAIIREQSLIIGEDLAKSRALGSGVVDFPTTSINDVSIQQTASPTEHIDKLVASYGEVFGPASIEVCLDVLRRYSITDVEPFISEDLRVRLSR